MKKVILAFVLTGPMLALPISPAAALAVIQEPALPTDTPQAAPTIDLNTADQRTLETLPGIGPRMAELIIEYRTEAGGFQKVEELMNVRGIGERTFLRLRELVTVKPPGEPIEGR